MRFSDTGMVFEEELCEKAPVLKELTLPISFLSVCKKCSTVVLYTFSTFPPTPTNEPFRV